MLHINTFAVERIKEHVRSLLYHVNVARGKWNTKYGIMSNCKNKENCYQEVINKANSNGETVLEKKKNSLRHLAVEERRGILNGRTFFLNKCVLLLKSQTFIQ